MLQPRRPELARTALEALDQPASFVELGGERLDATHLGCDFGERARRIRVQLGQPSFRSVELPLHDPHPGLGLVGQRPQLRLGRDLARDDLTQAFDQGEIEFLGQAAHGGLGLTDPAAQRRNVTVAWRTRVFGSTGPTSSMFFVPWKSEAVTVRASLPGRSPFVRSKSTPLTYATRTPLPP